MTQLTFDPGAHKYTLNGIPTQSVTQIMQGAGVIDTQWYTEWAAERGSRVHKAIHYHIQGDLDEESIDPNDRPYFDAYLKFRREGGLDFLVSELHVHNVARHYAGTLDLVAEKNKKITIIDWKTGVPDRAVAIQLTGYALALATMWKKPPMTLATVQLKPDGTYKFKEHEFIPRVFLAALEVARWKAAA